MTQNELLKQALDYIDYNLNDDKKNIFNIWDLLRECYQ